MLALLKLWSPPPDSASAAGSSASGEEGLLRIHRELLHKARVQFASVHLQTGVAGVSLYQLGFRDIRGHATDKVGQAWTGVVNLFFLTRELALFKLEWEPVLCSWELSPFWGAFRRALRKEPPSLVFRLRYCRIVTRCTRCTRCTCLESFAGCCPGCLGRPNSPGCQKSKWWLLPPCLINYHIVWTSALILWSDLDLSSSANLTLNHAPPPRLSCFTPRAHTSNGICGQNKNPMSSVHDKLSHSKKG